MRGQALAGSDIFISYSRQDRNTAEQFAVGLAEEGFAVWWDDAIHSGETFDEVIEEELRAAKAVVVLWSPRSVTSRWVRAEATLADRRRKLSPVIIEPCEKPIIFELTHTVDLSHWDGDRSDRGWQVFVKDLRRMTGAAQPAPAPVSAPPTASPPFREPARAIPLPTLREPEVADEEEYNPTQAFTRMTEEELIAASAVHCIELVQDGTVERRVPIGPTGVRIGRSAPAELVLPDPRISRSHCKVELVAQQVLVTDLNSTNGTYVDGIRVLGDAVLTEGSTLNVGAYDLVYRVRNRGEL